MGRDLSRSGKRSLGPSAITIQFSTDVGELVKMGVRVEKGANLAEGAGVGAGAATAIGGDLLIGLGIAVAGAIIGGISREYKKHKIEEMRTKWRGVFAAMGRDELEMFIDELERYYPATLPALQSSLLGTTATSRLLS